MLRYSTLETPAGAFTAVVDDDGSVRASGFTHDVALLIALIHPSLVEEAAQVGDLGDVTRAVRSYLDGDLAAIDAVPVRQKMGGTFITHASPTPRSPSSPGVRWPSGARPRPAPRTCRPCSSRVTGCCGGTARWAVTAGACR